MKKFILLMFMAVSAGTQAQVNTFWQMNFVKKYTILTTQTPGNGNQNDHNVAVGIETGVKFRTTVAGYVLGVRYYRQAGNAGPHIGELYSYPGAVRLAQATYSDADTSIGWHSVIFSTAVAVAAGTTYIAAYFDSLGNYTSTASGYASAITNGLVTGLASGTDGVNGLYLFTSTPAIPTNSFNSNNYFADVIFSTKP
jgi:hypothetical protein